MQSPITRLVFLRYALLLSVTFSALPLNAAITPDKVGVTVQVRNDGEAVDSTRGRAETQARFLEINVTNRTREELAGLNVKWTFLGYDLKDDEIAFVDSGDVKSTLAPSRSEVIKTKTVKFNYSRAGSQKVKGRGKGKRNGRVKRVPASGTRYAGWGVQVFQNGSLVGEAYSRPELKDEI